MTKKKQSECSKAIQYLSARVAVLAVITILTGVIGLLWAGKAHNYVWAKIAGTGAASLIAAALTASAVTED